MRRNEELRQLIRDNGLKNYEVAEEIGISRTSISNWLASKNMPKYQKNKIVIAVKRLAKEREMEDEQ